MAAEIHIDVVLVHYPVVNRNDEIIGSAVTNLDLHDIARASKTFGVSAYWVVTPYEQQRELSKAIVGHWTNGYGGTVNPDRSNALSIIRICDNLDEVIKKMSDRDGRPPMLVATSAGNQENSITYSRLQTELEHGTSVLLLFGTAWGLAPEVMQRVDATLPPIKGAGAFNHLSVRSAASIVLDRLLGNRADDE